jgi:hypothetical protein
MDSRFIVLIRLPWYKDASGFVAVLSWLTLVFTHTYALIGDMAVRWQYSVALICFATICSLYRAAGKTVELEDTHL